MIWDCDEAPLISNRGSLNERFCARNSNLVEVSICSHLYYIYRYKYLHIANHTVVWRVHIWSDRATNHSTSNNVAETFAWKLTTSHGIRVERFRHWLWFRWKIACNMGPWDIITERAHSWNLENILYLVRDWKLVWLRWRLQWFYSILQRSAVIARSNFSQIVTIDTP